MPEQEPTPLEVLLSQLARFGIGHAISHMGEVTIHELTIPPSVARKIRVARQVHDGRIGPLTEREVLTLGQSILVQLNPSSPQQPTQRGTYRPVITGSGTPQRRY